MRERLNRYLPDIGIIVFLLIVPLLTFFPQTVGGKTLVPVDNLYQWEPYASLAGEVGVGRPHNGLLSDLILENTVWKQFIRQQLSEGEIPLWQPYIAGGAPFLAAGQSSPLYPFSVIFLIMPLTAAYGWFTVSQLWLAGVCMYIFVRVLGVRQLGGLIAALTYQLSGFFLVSVVFPMIIATAAWLPFELAMVELTIRQSKTLGDRPATIPWVALGAIGLGTALLAGHVEASYFTLLVMGFYAAWRLTADLITRWREPGKWKWLLIRGVWLLVLVGMGLALGAVQILPAYELASRSFREGAVTLEQVRGWAYPARRVLAFLMPNFFGSPAHHTYFDLFRWQYVPVTANAAGDPIDNTHWGIKNYVEGGAYLGLLPMALALIAVVHWLYARIRRGKARLAPEKHIGNEQPGRPYRALFATLAALSVSFVFGTPTYALLYYGLPFINQSHSPFRWVWPLTLSVAVLAGFGADILQAMWRSKDAEDVQNRPPETLPHHLAYYLGWGSIYAGAVILVGLVASRLLYGAIEGTVQRVFEGLALAPTAFPDGRAFYSYQFRNVSLFAKMLIATGIVLRVSQCGIYLPERFNRRPVWEALAVGVVTLDLGIAITGFFPAADPALLEVMPPSIAWLREQAGIGNGEAEVTGESPPQPWRFVVYEEPGADTMNSNIGWLHGLQDASGYDSLIPGQYADYMQIIQPQTDLPYNRIAPIYSDHPDALNSPLLDLLNVKYVVSEIEINNPKYELAYEDEAVLIYENLAVMPRAFTLPASSTVYYAEDDQANLPPFDEEARRLDVRHYVLVALGDEIPPIQENLLVGLRGNPGAATITVYTANELWIDVQVDEESWLVVTDSTFPGWRAWVREWGADDDAEQETTIWLVDGNFRGVLLEPGTWTIRMKYSPDLVKLGAFTSFMAGMVIIFAVGVWGWRYAYRESDEASDMRRIAKNSLTPIVLNLFNGGIQFAFAFIMLRILGPEGSGKYQYAIVIWSWFEIIANFGLDTLLMREVARSREDGNRYLINTGILRLALAILGIPLLAAFIAIRQNLPGTDPLAADTITAIWVLYAGLFLATLNKGLTGLFYAYEKAEYTAALQTVSTFLVAMLGVIALLMGFGIVGLAGVSIIVNAIQFIVLGTLAVRLFFVPRLTFDWALQRGAISESFPLMLNHLLSTLFFRIDIILLEALTNAIVVGWYSVVYKWILAINVIPAFFTQALFPVLSRQAAEDRAAVKRSYIFSVKLLSLVSMPTAVVTTLLAYILVGFLGGPKFLPHGAIALQIFVWSIPIGWINSVTNYVIIALNRQRVLTWAFVIGVVFNVATNLVFIPLYSYPAAAVITIFSELVLLIAFYIILAQEIGAVPWVRILWRIVAATALMSGATWALASVHIVLALLGGVVVYSAAVVLLRPLDAGEMARIAEIMPEGLRTRVMRREGASEVA